MNQLLEDQLNRTKLLMRALEVAKISNNPLVEELSRDIRACVDKSKQSLDRSKEFLRRKKEISVEMDKLANKCDMLAERVCKVNQTAFPEQSFNNSTPSKSGDQNTIVEQHFNGPEVSPCPVAWLNGALESPMTCAGPSRNTNQLALLERQAPYIKPLSPNEMQKVPAYMKGRLTCENVNSFIATLNFVLKQKYAITKLKKKDVKRKDLIQYCEWKSQEEEFNMNGKVFFTAEDLFNLGHHKMDKIADKMVQILRHTDRLRQTRANGKVVVYSLMSPAGQ